MASNCRVSSLTILQAPARLRGNRQDCNEIARAQMLLAYLPLIRMGVEIFLHGSILSGRCDLSLKGITIHCCIIVPV